VGNFRIPLIFLHYGVGFGTLHFQGCQDIIGPIPPSFLISMVQIKTKKLKIMTILKKFINLPKISG
jgi:hypothetical protein